MERAFLEQLGLEEAAVEAILAEHGKARQSWEDKYRQLQFQTVLESAVAAAGGRSGKAIAALLDVESLQASEDPQAAVKKALAQLRQEHGYLFEQARPPAYARGTGSSSFAPEGPQTLSAALKEKFQR